MHETIANFPVNRGLFDYADLFGFTPNTFIDWLVAHPTTLDIASGGGNLAHEVNLLKKNTPALANVRVLSTDLLYTTPEWSKYSTYAVHLSLNRLHIPATKELIHETLDKFKNFTYGADFQRLALADESVDGVIACYSFGAICTRLDQLTDAFSEVFRVMRPHGEGFITVLSHNFPETYFFGQGKFATEYSINDFDYLKPSPHYTTRLSSHRESLIHYFWKITK